MVYNIGMKIKIKLYVALVVLLVSAVFAGGFGWQSSTYINQVTPGKLTACQSDEYVMIVSQIAFYRMMGATKDQVKQGLAEDIPANVKEKIIL